MACGNSATGYLFPALRANCSPTMGFRGIRREKEIRRQDTHCSKSRCGSGSLDFCEEVVDRNKGMHAMLPKAVFKWAYV